MVSVFNGSIVFFLCSCWSIETVGVDEPVSYEERRQVARWIAHKWQAVCHHLEPSPLDEDEMEPNHNKSVIKAKRSQPKTNVYKQTKTIEILSEMQHNPLIIQDRSGTVLFFFIFVYKCVKTCDFL